MKNWLTQVAGLAMVAAFALTSCEKDETQANLTAANTPNLTASTNTVVLQQSNSAQNAITFSWAPVTYNWSNTENTTAAPAVTYVLEIDKKDNGFAKPVTVDLGNSTSRTLTVGALNSSLNALGIANGVASALDVRLKAFLAANSPQYSPTVALTATPYKVCVPPNSDIWSIIGPAGVDWNTDVPLTYDCDTRTYKVTRAFNAGEFKFRRNSDWGFNYGDDAADGALENNGANIAVATAGNYTLTLNLNATPKPTFTLVRQ